MCARSILALRLGLVALSAVLLTTPAAAQTGLATVTGIVSDETGGAVPGLTVTATNQATNIAYTGVTNDAGNYIITSVPIGAYVICGGAAGLQERPVHGHAVGRADGARRLQAGARHRRGAGRGGRDRRGAADRERGRRQPASSASRSRSCRCRDGTCRRSRSTRPARRPPSPSQFDSLRGGGRPAVNGQRQQANNFTLDGVDSNEAINNGIAYQPSPDAVEQVSVETEQLLGRARATWPAPSSTW